ncbi:O-acetyl-ADP-ribose deacetylase [Hufsiella ginkgonis]|uniref:O-acetyl-ADP-ribose deacetylase n=1 Tax=Hufsiella ginkgonis TaxID=2695274 RepID=A0A7K1XYK0_9SPHI|nr:O-acetyl-ADP-ribose deacetylase [Hufsiella ginkgonis]MXV15908.1 O-acetyl-ADP-ribose deacetylase [Hufsiella ginkgonis]
MEPAKLTVVKGDITKIAADAIVNAANSSLMGGGGVDGAIHRKGGPKILDECRDIVARQGGLATGEAVITTAGKLPAKYVIHTVGPVWRGGNDGEPGLLRNCYLNSLDLANKYQVVSVAFPGISTGIYGYPKADAAKVAVETVTEHLHKLTGIREVLFVCFDEESERIYRELIPGR